MRGFAGRTMRAVGNYRGARTISIALVAGLLVFEAALVYGAGAVGIPGLFLLKLSEQRDAHVTSVAEGSAGGESVVAKPAAAVMPTKRSAETEASTGEPRLDGLADIPLQDWIVPRPKTDDAKAFGETAKPQKEDLPWDAVEPVPFNPPGPTPVHADAAAAIATPSVPTTPAVSAAVGKLPANATVEGWVKAKATEVKGEERARPLYHFEFWLDAPEEVKRELVAVSYEFNTPAVRPQSQISSERNTSFRVYTGGLACAERVTVTLKFNDGRTQQVAVDGCRLVSSA